jgi:hypothetical protein
LVTPAASAEVLPPPVSPDAAALPGAAEPPAAADELDELDEQAATMSAAAPTESAPAAIRTAFLGRLVVLKPSTHPRIVFIQGLTSARRPRGVPWHCSQGRVGCNRLSTQISQRYFLRRSLYRHTSNRLRERLCQTT